MIVELSFIEIEDIKIQYVVDLIDCSHYGETPLGTKSMFKVYKGALGFLTIPIDEIKREVFISKEFTNQVCYFTEEEKLRIKMFLNTESRSKIIYEEEF